MKRKELLSKRVEGKSGLGRCISRRGPRMNNTGVCFGEHRRISHSVRRLGTHRISRDTARRTAT